MNSQESNLEPKLVKPEELNSKQFGRWCVEEDKDLILQVENLEKSWKKFRDNFKPVEACGGLVFNQENKLLCIYRNTHWDLPKGKLEKHESYSQCALREVEEETGVKARLINSEIFWKTYHVYFHKNEWVLKTTYWYKMAAENSINTIPQREEGIEEVRWMNAPELRSLFLANTYRSIAELLARLIQ